MEVNRLRLVFPSASPRRNCAVHAARNAVIPAHDRDINQLRSSHRHGCYSVVEGRNPAGPAILVNSAMHVPAIGVRWLAKRSRLIQTSPFLDTFSEGELLARKSASPL